MLCVCEKLSFIVVKGKIMLVSVCVLRSVVRRVIYEFRTRTHYVYYRGRIVFAICVFNVFEEVACAGGIVLIFAERYHAFAFAFNKRHIRLVFAVCRQTCTIQFFNGGINY